MAKTGSQSLIRLLVKQGQRLGFEVTPKIRQVESVADDEQGIADEISHMSGLFSPNVIVRHYSFIDFEKHLYGWSPDWFNIVRDPIDKVLATIGEFVTFHFERQ